MSLITDTQTLTDFCNRLAKSDFITVDTEFIREKTYWPQLCVLQIGGEDEAECIDALADGIDLTPVYDLMADTSVLKVFHAARQDLEIFFHLDGKLPTPLFDTQVAAMVCGFGESAGYETLVRKLVGAQVDKSSRFTDWAQRPLTDKQIVYALGDVTHLRIVYEQLNKQLGSNGRRAWLEEEHAKLTNLKIYDIPPDEAWKRVKARTPKPRFLAILRELAAWREKEARRKDMPRNRILRDEALVEIAHTQPNSVEKLARTRGLGARMAEGTAGQQLLVAVETGKAVPDSDCPRIPRKPTLPRGIGPIMDILKVLLKMKCEEHDVAPKLVANSDDIEKLAAFGEDADVPALSGWRRDVFGVDALALKAGKLALIVDGKKLELVEFDEE